MANALTGLVWTVDTVGLLSPTPVIVKKIRFYPNSAGNGATFKYYNFGSATYKSEGLAQTATVSTNAVTSTGNFVTANVAAGDGLEITYTSTGNNVGKYYVVSRDSDNAVTLSYATMTDEASKKYTWRVYAQQMAVEVDTAATEAAYEEVDFGDGKWFPSLACTAISSSSDKCYIYIA